MIPIEKKPDYKGRILIPMPHQSLGEGCHLARRLPTLTKRTKPRSVPLQSYHLQLLKFRAQHSHSRKCGSNTCSKKRHRHRHRLPQLLTPPCPCQHPGARAPTVEHRSNNHAHCVRCRIPASIHPPCQMRHQYRPKRPRSTEMILLDLSGRASHTHVSTSFRFSTAK